MVVMLSDFEGFLKEKHIRFENGKWLGNQEQLYGNRPVGFKYVNAKDLGAWAVQRIIDEFNVRILVYKHMVGAKPEVIEDFRTDIKYLKELRARAYSDYGILLEIALNCLTKEEVLEKLKEINEL